jgi:hypothetical protein
MGIMASLLVNEGPFDLSCATDIQGQQKSATTMGHRKLVPDNFMHLSRGFEVSQPNPGAATGMLM